MLLTSIFNICWLVMARTLVSLLLVTSTHFSGSLIAGTILQPAGVTVHLPLTENRPAVELINQSGLSSGYSSLIDDFNEYTAGFPMHADRFTGKWQTETDFTLPGNIDFDLGRSFTVSAMALWNTDDRNAVDRFTVLADDNRAFSSPEILGEFTAREILTPQVFEFIPVHASHLRMTITAADGDRVRIGEVAFNVVALFEEDFDGDGQVGFSDFTQFANAFNMVANGDTEIFDLDGSGFVDFPDFIQFANAFGKTSTVLVPEFSSPNPAVFGLLGMLCLVRRTKSVRKSAG